MHIYRLTLKENNLSLFTFLRYNEYGVLTINTKFNQDSCEYELEDFFKYSKGGKNEKNLFTLYDYINLYMETLPESSQQELYALYSKAYKEEVYINYMDQDNVAILENDLQRATELLDYTRFKIFVHSTVDKIQIPKDINDEFTYDPNMNTTREKTYIKSEYVDLIALVMFIRALVPVYITYYNYIKQTTPYYHYRLYLIFNNIEELANSPEIDKLRTYIDFNKMSIIDKNKTNISIINNGFSDDDIIDSLVAEVIFSKLIVIDFYNDQSNFIAFIYQTIRYKGKFSTATEDTIKNKTTMTDPNKEDMSYFEDYRKATTIPLGVITEIQYSLSDTDRIIQTIGASSYDPLMYKEELKNIKVYEDNRLEKVQINLLGWMLNKYINPRALFYIDYRKLVELTLLSKVILLKNNHGFIGSLLGSYSDKSSTFMNVLVRHGISKDYIDELKPYFTFINLDNKENVIKTTIEEMVEQIVSINWIPVGNVDSRYVSSKDNYLIIPDNINELMCSFIKFCVS